MTVTDPATLEADLARAGITLPARDLEAARRIAQGLADGARRVRAYLDREDGDAPR